MEIAILICCIIIIVLLIALFVKLSADNSTDDISELETEIEMLRESTANDGRNIINYITTQSESLRSAQERQSDRADGIFEKFRGEIGGFKAETAESLNKINRIITEKLRDILDTEFESVVKNMTELGKSLNDSQDVQRKATADSIKALEDKFTAIRGEILKTLNDIREENTHSIEKLRRENKESLDVINDTVNEKLQ
ncbi:MAG: hypothetical protein IJR59_03775, partial [Firmicutes bacterium]|nr:hypothetical protein [Bacillota bacterium]